MGCNPPHRSSIYWAFNAAYFVLVLIFPEKLTASASQEKLAQFSHWTFDYFPDSPAYGAALLAMIGADVYSSGDEAQHFYAGDNETTVPYPQPIDQQWFQQCVGLYEVLKLARNSR